MIDCIEISKKFTQRRKEVIALDRVSLTIEEGEFVILTGPGGSGKTTLLSILGGQMLPDQGEAYLWGQCMQKMKGKEKSQFCREMLGFVFQETSIIQGLTVIENVRLPLSLSQVEKNMAMEKASEMLGLLGIEEMAQAYPSELSTGEKQLVALARALTMKPKILLLDEPTKHLDHQYGVKVFTLLMQLARDHEVSILSVTTDIRLHPFAHRIVKMRQGRIDEILGEKLFEEDSSPPFLKI